MGNCSSRSSSRSSSRNCRRSIAEAKVFMACPLHLISSITKGGKDCEKCGGGYVRHVPTEPTSCGAKVQLVRGIRKVSEQRAKLSADCSSTVIVISRLREREGDRDGGSARKRLRGSGREKGRQLWDSLGRRFISRLGHIKYLLNPIFGLTRESTFATFASFTYCLLVCLSVWSVCYNYY